MGTPGPTFMSKVQVGQQPLFPSSVRSLDQSVRSSPLKNVIFPYVMPQAGGNSDSYQYPTAAYLTELRANPLQRPTGSRPQPAASAALRNGTSNDFIPSTKVPPPAPRASARSRYSHNFQYDVTGRSSSVNSHRRYSAAPGTVLDVGPGRALVKPPLVPDIDDFPPVAKTTEVLPSAIYLENGQRWMEKQEARSLSSALHDMDLQQEASLHAAALDEAAMLVWEHQNPGVPNAKHDKPYSYRQHLKKGSHARTQSATRYASALMTQSQNSSNNSSRVSSGSSGASAQPKCKGPGLAVTPKIHELWDSPEKKAYLKLTKNPNRAHSQERRRSSGPRSRNVSGESGPSLFRNPHDQIYEEPEKEIEGHPSQTEVAMPAPLSVKHRNSVTAFPPTQEPPVRANTLPIVAFERVPPSKDITNVPGQPRAAGYITNSLHPTPPDSADASDPEARTDGDETPRFKNGIEIRNDEIRQATSMRLKDRSPRLPVPTVMSDKPGRPIVSFDPNWRPKENAAEEQKKKTPWQPKSPFARTKTVPSATVPKASSARASAPKVRAMETPSIQVNALPSINLPEPPSISIEVPSDTSSKKTTRPLPSTKANTGRPLPAHISSAPAAMSTPHYSLSGRRPTASCTQCSLPIAGRVVSAAGERFHSECFICFNCGEGLECVAFYPEPDQKRDERIGRIRLRAQGVPVEEAEGMTEAEDGDEKLRFYCHLDFHELYSPRCRSCKTPIEGEVVVACGGTWHKGHFFCAECGDVSRLPVYLGF